MSITTRTWADQKAGRGRTATIPLQMGYINIAHVHVYYTTVILLYNYYYYAEAFRY